MTLIWIAVAFVAGCLFWHWLGGKLLRLSSLNNNMRANVIRNLSTDALVAFQRDTKSELDRRVRVTEQA